MNLAVIDLETTGTDENAGSILEVGVVIVGPDLVLLDVASWLVHPNPDDLANMDQKVVEMHRTSQLLADLEAGDNVHLLEVVDAQLSLLLDKFTIDGRIALAGSGVGHFDSRWLRRHLPHASKRLTYWAYDVGVVRRFLRDLCGWIIPPIDVEKPHRALDDAVLHLAEMRTYRDALSFDFPEGNPDEG